MIPLAVAASALPSSLSANDVGLLTGACAATGASLARLIPLVGHTSMVLSELAVVTYCPLPEGTVPGSVTPTIVFELSLARTAHVCAFRHCHRPSAESSSITLRSDGMLIAPVGPRSGMW